MRAYTRALIVVAIAFAVAWALAGELPRGAATAEAAAEFEDASCPVPLPDGQTESTVRCGFVSVPEDRAHNNGRTIRLAVAVLKSTAADPAPDPLIYLTGGPGAPALTGEFQYLGRRDVAAFAQSKRDFIFFDQRGTGFSGELFCPEAQDLIIDDLAHDRIPSESRQVQREALLACRDRLLDEGVDLAQYTSATSARDIAAIAASLGYKSYNLYGTSYGTRLALTAMRETPQGIRSVVLDSTVPLQVSVDLNIAPDLQRSLARLFNGCRIDPECNAAYPDLEAHYWEVVRRANETPIQVTIRNRLGEEQTLYIRGSAVLMGTFVALYSEPVFRLFPLAIEEIYQGHYGIVQVLAQRLVFSFDFIAQGMSTSVNCSEEVPFFSAEEMLRLNRGVRQEIIDTELGVSTVEGLNDAQALCRAWGARTPASRENQPVVSNIPALILGGEYDPITPPAWGALAGKTLGKSHFFEFPSAGHGVIYHAYDCASSMVSAFLAEPDRQPDAACIGAIAPVDFPVLPPSLVAAPEPSPSPTSGLPAGTISGPDTGDGATAGGSNEQRLVVAAVLLMTGAVVTAGGIRARRRAIRR